MVIHFFELLIILCWDLRHINAKTLGLLYNGKSGILAVMCPCVHLVFSFNKIGEKVDFFRFGPILSLSLGSSKIIQNIF